jgi:hypothetical protein
MNADRIINPYTNKVVMGTLPDGTTYYGAGPYRVRYNPNTGINYEEVKWNGVWYIDSSVLDSAIDMTGHAVSDIQDIT